MNEDNNGLYSLFKIYERKIMCSNDIQEEIITAFMSDLGQRIGGFYRDFCPSERERIFILSNSEETQIRLHGYDSALIESHISKWGNIHIAFNVSSMDEDNIDVIKDIIDALYIKYVLKYDKRDLENVFHKEEMKEVLRKVINDIDEESEKRLSDELGEEYDKMKWKILREDDER